MNRFVRFILLLPLLLAGVSCESSSENGGGNEPDIPEVEYDVVFEAKSLSGYYFGEYYTPNSDNYYFFLSDNGFDEQGEPYPNSTYYMLDIYTAVKDLRDSETVPLPKGVFRLDRSDSYAHGTLSASGACIRITDANGEYIGENIYYDRATLTIEEEHIVLEATIDGKSHLVTYNGALDILNDNVRPTEDVEAEMFHYIGEYFGERFGEGVGNYFIRFSDVGWRIDDGVEYNLPNGRYYSIDIFGELFSGDTSAGVTIPQGEYIIDTTNSCAMNTISCEFTQYWLTDEAAETSDFGYVSSGALIVDENGMRAEFVINGATHTITYSGVPLLVDRSTLD